MIPNEYNFHDNFIFIFIFISPDRNIVLFQSTSLKKTTTKRKADNTIEKYFTCPTKTHSLSAELASPSSDESLANVMPEVIMSSPDLQELDSNLPRTIIVSEPRDNNSPNEAKPEQQAREREQLKTCNDQTGSTYDIGNYVGKPIDDLTRRNILLHPWMPDKDYKFSFSLHNNNKTKRFASHKHLNSYEWLVYSNAEQGFFCKYCPLFVNAGLGGPQNSTPLKRLVTEPLNTYAKLYGKDGYLDTHNNNKYHKNAVQAAKDFLNTNEHSELCILNRVNAERDRQVKENRDRLKPVVETIILMGQQNIAFRGHRDDGPLNLENSSVINEGNFRALLRLRVQSGDTILRDHLKNASARATYISKTTQNEIIGACGDEILTTILKRIQSAGIFSIMFDESADCSEITQLTLILRYLHENAVYESFVGFIDIRSNVFGGNTDEVTDTEPKVTGIDIGKVVIQKLRDLNLDLKNCVGISTDGCSVMVSEARGAVATIKKEATNAVYSPCHNHALNLSISQTSKIRQIKNAVDTMQETIYFFRASPKRMQVLKKALGHQLSGLCETRWIERHDGVLQFRSALPKIISALESVGKWNDPKSSVKARGLKSSLCNSQTIIAILCLSDLLTCTHQLSVFFQRICLDLKSAQEELNDTIIRLESRRKNAELVFATLFEEACVIAEELGVSITRPRIVGKQTQRENHPVIVNDNSSYFRQSMYIPALDHILGDLKTRFSRETLQLYNLHILFPNQTDDSEKEIMQQLIVKYGHFFNKPIEVLHRMFESELESWKLKWKRANHGCPQTAIDMLENCDKDVYPYIHFLLSILITLPVSNATAERTFSSLRRLKSWLRSTMEQERLTGLALLNIHRDINVSPENIVNRYAKIRKHRDEFVLD